MCLDIVAGRLIIMEGNEMSDEFDKLQIMVNEHLDSDLNQGLDQLGIIADEYWEHQNGKIIKKVKALKDIEARGLEIMTFICKTKEGKLQALSYDNAGLIEFISDKVDAMNINEQLQGRMIRPIATIRPKETT